MACAKPSRGGESLRSCGRLLHLLPAAKYKRGVAGGCSVTCEIDTACGIDTERERYSKRNLSRTLQPQTEGIDCRGSFGSCPRGAGSGVVTKKQTVRWRLTCTGCIFQGGTLSLLRLRRLVPDVFFGDVEVAELLAVAHIQSVSLVNGLLWAHWSR